MSDVPLSAHLPIGMRMMHDAYLFIYLIATFISVMLSKVNANMNQTQLWRTDGLIRLYVGYLLFVLSERLNPVKRSMTFEQWYMFFFFDVQLWERATKAHLQGDQLQPQQQQQQRDQEPNNAGNNDDNNNRGGSIWGNALASLFSSRVRAPVRRPHSRSNLLVAGLHESALHNFANASDSLHSKEMRVLEVVRRITHFAKVRERVFFSRVTPRHMHAYTRRVTPRHMHAYTRVRPRHMHAYTHIHTYTHTRTHLHTSKHTHIQIHTLTRTNIHAHNIHTHRSIGSCWTTIG